MQDDKPEGEEETAGRPARSKEELWSTKKARRILKELERSGETVAHFARRHGWTPQRLHWWMTKLKWRQSRPPAPASEGPRFVPVRVVPDPVPPLAAARPTVGAAGVVIELCSGRRVRVEPAFDVEVLRQVVRVLEEGPSC